MERDIVAQVDPMPVESRRVGEDPQRIVGNLELSIERLDHDARAGLVVDDEMNRLRLGRKARGEGRRNDDSVRTDRRAYFVEGGEIGQEPGPEVDDGNGPRLIVLGRLRVTGEGREIKDSDR